MKLPRFLIIGAMKSGTTTLYSDLKQHPGVFMPDDKEPSVFCDDAILTDAGLARYAGYFDLAKPGQLIGEASTAYTKLPKYPGVPERARRVLGPDIKLIYIVRDPVKRVISHHHHIYHEGIADPSVRTDADINKAVYQTGELLDFSRYAMQAAPWIEAFGRENLKLVIFEEMVADRQKVADEVWAFLGLEPGVTLADPERAVNQSQGKLYHSHLSKLVCHSWLYRSLIRPWLSTGFRSRFQRMLTRTAQTPLAPPTQPTLAYIKDQLRDDAQRFAQLTGKDLSGWSL